MEEQQLVAQKERTQKVEPIEIKIKNKNQNCSIRNLALEEKAASQHVRPSLRQGPPASQKAPSEEAETSSTVLSIKKKRNGHVFTRIKHSHMLRLASCTSYFTAAQLKHSGGMLIFNWVRWVISLLSKPAAGYLLTC